MLSKGKIKREKNFTRSEIQCFLGLFKPFLQVILPFLLKKIWLIAAFAKTGERKHETK